MTKTNLVPVLELRRLLYGLKDLRPNIGIRLRIMGQMWHVNHNKVIQLTEKGAVIQDEVNKQLISIPDLNQIMQFEIDGPFQNYQPHVHYSVDPTLIH